MSALTQQEKEDRLLVLWDVYVVRVSGLREWLGSVVAPVCVDPAASLTKHAVEESRRQFMAVLKDDDPEVEPTGTTIKQLQHDFQVLGLL